MNLNIVARESIVSTPCETILVVEDSDTVRSLLQRVLSINGYNTLAAQDGQEAVEIARTHADAIQLVIADVVLPKLQGQALADELRAVMPDVKILFVSGHSDEVVAAAGVDTENSFLAKPFTNATLTRTVQEMLNPLAKESSVS